MARVLVTGGAGFIGSHVVDALIDRGHRVTVIDNLSNGKRGNLHESAELICDDINSSRLPHLFRDVRPEYVFHLAAQTNLRASLSDPLHDAEVNIIGSLRIFEQAARWKVKRLIFSSTGGAMYGTSKIKAKETDPANPISPYGLAKLTAEKYLGLCRELYGLSSVILRYANVYGPRQNVDGEAGVVSIFAHRAVHGQPLLINGKGDQTRDYVHVRDVVAANMAAMKKNAPDPINISTGTQTSVNALVEAMKRAGHPKLRHQRRPAIAGEAQRISLDWTRAKRQLGWRPTVSLKDGIAETLAWVKNGGGR